MTWAISGPIVAVKVKPRQQYLPIKGFVCAFFFFFFYHDSIQLFYIENQLEKVIWFERQFHLLLFGVHFSFFSFLRVVDNGRVKIKCSVVLELIINCLGPCKSEILADHLIDKNKNKNKKTGSNPAHCLPHGPCHPTSLTLCICVLCVKWKAGDRKDPPIQAKIFLFSVVLFTRDKRALPCPTALLFFFGKLALPLSFVGNGNGDVKIYRKDI